MDDAAAKTGSLADLGNGEVLATVAIAAIWLVFAFFFFRLFWKLLRAQLRAPEELAGIRVALERIASALEKDRR